MSSETVSVVRAGVDDLERIALLFDLYRQFYEQVSDPQGAKDFIGERLRKGESTIFMAVNHEGERDDAAGFVQLYPIFSSVSMVRVWLLNDLFVHPGHRRLGVGRLLMQRAIHYARETGYRRIELATAADNHEAQRLYEDLGFNRSEGFHHYQLEL